MSRLSFVIIIFMNQMEVICTCESMLIRMKLEEFKGFVFENNVQVAKLSVSTYQSRWTDTCIRSEIGSIQPF